MRLDIIDNRHRARSRLFMSVTARMSGVEMADVVKVLLYRPELFGHDMVELSARTMRGPTFWTAGEREYMAWFTAQLYGLRFCIDSHAELTRIASDGEIDPADSSSLRPEVSAVLGFLERASRTPDLVTADDLEAARNAGVPDDATVEALYVSFIWNTINRLGNAFGFQLYDGQLVNGTRSLHRFGYRLPRFLLAAGRRTDDRTAVTGNDARGRLVARLWHRMSGSPSGVPLPAELERYAAKVRDESHRITDDDVERLKAAGHSEDEIFEATIAAAVDAARHSLDAGLRAVRGDA